MTSDPVKGGLFRRNYVREPVLLADSDRARFRLFKMFWHRGKSDNRGIFVDIVERKLGVRYPMGTESYNHQRFWLQADIADVLSAITIWYRLNAGDQQILDEARIILAEEQLRYRIDDIGGVHFFVDEEFERLIQATIAGLGAPRFKASLHALEQALENLNVNRQSGKGLIRGVFEAVESAFLAVVNEPRANRLNKDTVGNYLKPILVNHYKSHPDATNMVDQQLEILNAWVKAAHPFRHGATPFDQIHEAPLDLALLSATQGMGYLRFLSGLPSHQP